MKSLIFGVDGEIVLAYVSGSNQLDEQKLALAAGGLKCQRVDADHVRDATGFPIGGVPPFGHTTHLRVFIDPDLLQYDEVWAAAGTWHDVFPIEPGRLVTRATVWSPTSSAGDSERRTLMPCWNCLSSRTVAASTSARFDDCCECRWRTVSDTWSK